jgi:alkylation response protein AidB-like acyl-CoA dehydrogenase
MDYDLTKEQQYIQKAAREFAVGEFSEVARDFDINETFPAEILKKARELDLVGLFIPEEYGGPGLGYFEQALVLEEFWKVDPGIAQELCSVSWIRASHRSFAPYPSAPKNCCSLVPKNKKRNTFRPCFPVTAY